MRYNCPAGLITGGDAGSRLGDSTPAWTRGRGVDMSDVNEITEQWFAADNDLRRALFLTPRDAVTEVQYGMLMAEKITRLGRLTRELLPHATTEQALALIRLARMLKGLLPAVDHGWWPAAGDSLMDEAEAVVDFLRHAPAHPDQTTVHPDGPEPPSSIWIDGVRHDLSPQSWRIAAHIWGKRASEEEAFAEAVWQEAAPTTTAIKTALSRFGTEIAAIQATRFFDLHLRNGHVVNDA